MTVIVVIALVAAFYMAWNVGANDVANSMADAVGSKAISIFWAVILAAICEFAGAVLVGSHVTNTVRKGIIAPEAFAANPMHLAVGMVCALLASGIWLNLASWFGMPVSTTHSIVGGIAGVGIVAAGFANVKWLTMGKIVASWFLSPVAGGLIAFVVFRLLTRFILSQDEPIAAARRALPFVLFFTFTIVALAIIFKGLKNLHLDLSGGQALGVAAGVGFLAGLVGLVIGRLIHRKSGARSLMEQLEVVEKIFAVLVVITSCSVAFAHGANDVANAVGPLAAVVEIANTGDVPKKVMVDPWVLAFGGGGIVIGLAMFGYRVMRLVGTKITAITPSRGVAADLGATVTVLACSKMGLPISTTHTLVGSIVGVGLARGVDTINTRTVRAILGSWLATVPVVAALAAVFYGIARVAFG